MIPNTRPSMEMALAMPTDEDKELFEKYIEPYDYLPKKDKIYEMINLFWYNKPKIFRTPRSLDSFFDRIIEPLAAMWAVRYDPVLLGGAVLSNLVPPDRLKTPDKDVYNTSLSDDRRIVLNIQNLREWVDYYTGGFYALWRPELKRMVNEIAIILAKKKVSPYRKETPRSELQTKNPVRTMEIAIVEEKIPTIDGSEESMWKATTTIVTEGRRSTKKYRAYFDRISEAYQSELIKDAKILSVKDYAEKYKEDLVTED